MDTEIKCAGAAAVDGDSLRAVVEPNFLENCNDSSDDNDDSNTLAPRKKRIQQLSSTDSESEFDSKLSKGVEIDNGENSLKSHESENSADSVSCSTSKSRIRRVTDNSDSDSASSPELIESTRIKSKRNKMQQKFKNLLSVREKVDVPKKSSSDKSNSSTDDEAASIEKIKQKIKERTNHLKSTIYDPDTSDDESSLSKSAPKHYKQRKSAKLTSPKPTRMSAKQAMENMQKIKSESNRMLREKEVSLPYHRPKALSLKDIMSRRRPALSADGKALPIKMNEEQLKHYALMLEQRQKEMMELCKSESEEEETLEDENLNKESNIIAKENSESIPTEIVSEELSGVENKELMESKNDSMFDDIVCSYNNSDRVQTKDNEDENESKKDSRNIILNIETNEENNDENTDDNLDKGKDDTDSMITTDSNNKNQSCIDVITITESKEKIAMETSTCDESAEMELTYNDSVESNKIVDSNNDINNLVQEYESTNNKKKINTEVDSQLISLHFDSERTDTENLDEIQPQSSTKENVGTITKNGGDENVEDQSSDDKNDEQINAFSDDDLHIEDIDRMIENAEILSQNKADKNFSPMLVRDSQPLKSKPKLTGTPGMVIDLDGTDPFAPKKSGVELLKERFSYFSKLKTPEEHEREREKRIKPGLQHLKLKQQLGEQIAEQRSMEWAKRLEDEKQQQKETETVMGNESDADDDIDKIDAKLDEMEDGGEEEEEDSSDGEEDIENVVDKPRKRNPLIADEAEESDCDQVDEKEENVEKNNQGEDKHEVDDEANDADEEDEDESSEESSESSDESENEGDGQNKPKKGRILRAFEDSDDEELTRKETSTKSDETIETIQEKCSENMDTVEATMLDEKDDLPIAIKDTQDEEIQLAQIHKSFSDDLFTSQESAALSLGDQKVACTGDAKDLGTQTFSILNSGVVDSSAVELPPVPDNLLASETQNYEEGNLDHVVGMCSGSFSQNLVASQLPDTQKSLDIGENVLAMCTGKFYDNQFVSQLDSSQNNNEFRDNDDSFKESSDENISDMNRYKNTYSQDTITRKSPDSKHAAEPPKCKNKNIIDTSKDVALPDVETNKQTEDIVLLKSILDELHDPEFDVEKPKKYFGDDDGNRNNKENDKSNVLKKRFVIDSDEEDKSKEMGSKNKKFKKKKMEKRALTYSDDEVEESEVEESEAEDASDIENEENEQRIVEYDSEENEVVIKPEVRKKKRKAADFLEQEAELTSEDEWVGSGDEDERGLDRMEREEGDDDQFNQKQLQRELEQIHMRDVLDQDKREVRMIQELLFEDGDLGGGGRQRKFRWRNADGEDDSGLNYEFTDTQEEEFESEEQWRKQRHEREMFLKQMKQEDADESVNMSISRTSIIKASLSCKGSLSSTIVDINESNTEIIEKTEHGAPLEKKTSKDIPSPKKPFSMFQQTCHNSLLSRGRGALARLAALAMPLAGDDNAPKGSSLAPSSKRSFVFTSITPDEEAPKVTIKRKAESSVGTPRLVKKMRIEEKTKHPRNSLLDHLKT